MYDPIYHILVDHIKKMYNNIIIINNNLIIIYNILYNYILSQYKNKQKINNLY